MPESPPNVLSAADNRVLALDMERWRFNEWWNKVDRWINRDAFAQAVATFGYVGTLDDARALQLLLDQREVLNGELVQVIEDPFIRTDLKSVCRRIQIRHIFEPSPEAIDAVPGLQASRAGMVFMQGLKSVASDSPFPRHGEVLKTHLDRQVRDDLGLEIRKEPPPFFAPFGEKIRSHIRRLFDEVIHFNGLHQGDQLMLHLEGEFMQWLDLNHKGILLQKGFTAYRNKGGELEVNSKQHDSYKSSIGRQAE